MSKISLKDIAREANVSVTTVSFILNGKGKENRISEAVVKRVKRIISEKKFTPNVVARGLRTGKTMVLGLIVEDIANYFFGNVAKTIELAAHKKGYNVVFGSTDNDEMKAKELLETFRHQQMDGFIITPTESLKEQIRQLKKEEKKFVLFDRYFQDVETNYVVLDNYAGAYDMTSHLISRGYKRIAFITNDSKMIQMEERLRGYIASLLDHGITFNENLVLKVTYNPLVPSDKMYKNVENFLKGDSVPDAVLFSTNYLGNLGLQFARVNNILLPSMLAMASFDDNDLFRLMKPSMTVVDQPIQKLANEAINTLMHLLHDNESDDICTQIKVKPKIIIREST